MIIFNKEGNKNYFKNNMEKILSLSVRTQFLTICYKPTMNKCALRPTTGCVIF